MGQRFQIFVNVHNPLNNESVREDLKGDVLKHAEVVFGNKKTSMLAYHNQWLYGMSAAATCANIMHEVDKSKNPVHILSKDFDRIPYPKNYTGDNDKVDGYFEIIEHLFFNLLDLKFANYGARYGMEKVHNLVDELYNRETGEFDSKYDIKKDFRRGDNNDGIMIVDAVNKKYCFMNIFDYNKGEDDDKSECVRALLSMVPVTAGEYVNAYYPTTKEKLHDSTMEEKTEKEIQTLLKDNQRRVNFVNKAFSKYELLSLDEIKKMFPAVYRKPRTKKVAESK